VGSGVDVTVNSTGLLSFIPGATETTSGPEVAPLGIVMVMEVALHELIVTSTPFKRTTPLPGEAPKFDPLITTWLPIDPVVAETLVMTGAGFAVELIDTLSNVPVYKTPVLPLLTASPT
jgi:hypothetical protein